ncbi:MAG: riboflavin biosynthesis protein RibF [Candidatus Omnitrophica bacterium]|jgi:riboflavin kinase/FMN adenylyltransferase|nr:riboflavin biosynthesis protein RibF [Candidatus Omnitrophota bacterium]MDD3274144.1 riboflavin biosynthesis protein RibF [Candidatus Omnitrophota bacterium]MDD5724582.1 riboflavin biosynthesis protein RibF [Candidatus Omnitrophota bacterium]
MKIIYGIRKIKKFRRPVAALGVFDGVHLGHRRILESVVRRARRVKGTSLVLTFWPHPQGKESLYSLAHRLRLIAELGVEVCVVADFGGSFRRVSADDFIDKVLVKKIGVYAVHVGKNFRFGYRASGDAALLVSEAQKYGFKVRIFPVSRSGIITVSSTAIRSLIKRSEIKKAEKLLGRRVSVLGTVVRGSRLGRLMGVPTANINPHHEVIPPPGIYASRIVFYKKEYRGVCYIGRRPTIVSPDSPLRVEVNIFDFHKDIYGKVLEIQFVKMIRKDRKFKNLGELSAQIGKDIAACRKIY